MHLLMNKICEFAKCTFSSRNYVEGEKILNSKHVIYCGKTREDEDTCTLIAYCLQTSKVREAPHEIKGIITKKGEIEKMQCSCKAGLSEACKHIVGVLLYLNRMNMDDLPEVSCTDKKCLWKIPHKTAVEVYNPVPVQCHECFQNQFCDANGIQYNEEKIVKIKERILMINPESAINKSMTGRHEPLISKINNNLSNEIKTLILLQESNFMDSLSKLETKTLQLCCELFLKNLDQDAYEICIRTKTFKTEWLKERRNRITGSRCYELITYSRNKNPNWESKTEKYFFPKPFSNKYVKHGIEFEPLARTAYEIQYEVKVVECGLVLCKQNPWLAYSPDGIVFEDGKPWKLLEIKCPYSGKKSSLTDVIKELKWIDLQSVGEESRVIFKHKQYYAQIQFGMAILNVESTDFVIYSAYDNNFLMFNIEYDEKYCKDMFEKLKFVYFENMLHRICTK